MKPLRRHLFHEAGHALAALAVGFRVISVDVHPAPRRPSPIPGRWVGGGVTVEWSIPAPDGHLERAALVLLAGPAAQRLQSGEPWGFDHVSDAAADVAEAQALGCPDTSLAWAFVGAYRPALESLADELSARGHLDGERVIALVDAAAPGLRGRVLNALRSAA